jgi:hypothetical protein
MTTKIFWNSAKVSFKILVASLIIKIQMKMKFFKELDDHRFLEKFFLFLIRILQDLDDTRI